MATFQVRRTGHDRYSLLRLDLAADRWRPIASGRTRNKARSVAVDMWEQTVYRRGTRKEGRFSHDSNIRLDRGKRSGG
jgi:hypothetical protein